MMQPETCPQGRALGSAARGALFSLPFGKVRRRPLYALERGTTKQSQYEPKRVCMLRDSDGSEVGLFPPMRGRPTQLFAADDYLVRAYPYQFRLSDRARSGGARSGAIRVSAVADRPTARSAITSPDPAWVSSRGVWALAAKAVAQREAFPGVCQVAGGHASLDRPHGRGDDGP